MASRAYKTMHNMKKEVLLAAQYFLLKSLPQKFTLILKELHFPENKDTAHLIDLSFYDNFFS